MDSNTYDEANNSTTFKGKKVEVLLTYAYIRIRTFFKRYGCRIADAFFSLHFVDAPNDMPDTTMGHMRAMI
jgi:hypothetical protein